MIRLGTVTVNLEELDGKEIQAGIVLIGAPTWNSTYQEWRCLANVGGALCLVSLNITVKGE
jgi:hypothetical protein